MEIGDVGRARAIPAPALHRSADTIIFHCRTEESTPAGDVVGGFGTHGWRLVASKVVVGHLFQQTGAPVDSS